MTKKKVRYPKYSTKPVTIEKGELDELKWQSTQRRLLEVAFSPGSNSGLLGWAEYEKTTKEEITKALRSLVERAFDPTRCNNSCKWLYFCEKPLGHRGKHGESGLVWDR